MEKAKFYCYICGTEITSKNETDEHIILNALGGHLHSKKIICENCNKRIGETADAKLAEDLSFYTDMLKVKKDRQNKHNQVMIDSEGHEIIDEDGGQSIYLRKPYIVVDSSDGIKNVHLTVRNMDELDSILKGLVKRNELKQEEADKILKEAKVSEYNPTLKTETCISEEAFPSIIKSAANLYVERTHDVKTVKHLVPYIEGKADCKDVLYLHHFKNLPYPEVQKQVTHMIHIEGSVNTGLLYAMMEYYSIFVYIVVLDKNYMGKDINLTYTYDVVSGQEVNRSFSLPMTINELDTFRNQPHEQYITYLPYIKKRADAVMNVWEQDKDKQELGDVVEKAFSKYPEGCNLTPEILCEVQKEIMDYFEKKIVRSFKIKNQYVLAFNWHDYNALGYIKRILPFIYDALSTESLSYSAWKKIEKFTGSVPFWRSWDNCRKVLIGVRDYCKSMNLRDDEMVNFTTNKKLNEELLDLWKRG